MRYIAFDLEWNSTPPNYVTRGINMHRLVKERISSLGLNYSIPEPFFPLDNEIIEIGAVKLDNEFKTIDRFQARVCPVRLPVLNPYVAKAIDISQEEMDNGSSFPEVIRQFYAWCRDDSVFMDRQVNNDDDVFLLAWSNSDSKAMKKNLRYYGLEDSIPFRTINVQKLFADYMGISEMLSLKKACMYLDIDETRKYHHAEDDAYYTAKIFQYLLAPLIDTVQKEKGSHIDFENRKLSLLGKKSLHELLREHKNFSYPKEKLQLIKTSISESLSHSSVTTVEASSSSDVSSSYADSSLASTEKTVSPGKKESPDRKLSLPVRDKVDSKENMTETRSAGSLNDNGKIPHASASSKSLTANKASSVSSAKDKTASEAELNVDVLEVNNKFFVNEFSAKPRTRKVSISDDDATSIVAKEARNAVVSRREGNSASAENNNKDNKTENEVREALKTSSHGLKEKLFAFFKKLTYGTKGENNVKESYDAASSQSSSLKNSSGASKSSRGLSFSADKHSFNNRDANLTTDVSSDLTSSAKIARTVPGSVAGQNSGTAFNNLYGENLDNSLNEIGHGTDKMTKGEQIVSANVNEKNNLTSSASTENNPSKDIYLELSVKRPDLKPENINLENKIEKQLLSKVSKIRKSEMLSDGDLKKILYHISQDSNLRRKSKYYFSKNLSDYSAFSLAKNMTFSCPSCNEKLFSSTPMQLISFGHLHGHLTCPNHGKFNLSLTINSYLIKKEKQKRNLSKKQRLFDLSTIALDRNEIRSAKAIIVDEKKIQKECGNLLRSELKFNNPSSVRTFSKLKDLSNLQLQEADKPNRKKRFIVYRDNEYFDYKKKQDISYMTKEDMKKGRAELAFSGTFTLNKAEE